MNLKIVVFFLLIGLKGLSLSAQIKMQECIFRNEDKSIVEEKLRTFSTDSELPVGELVARIGFSFLGTPYVAATLENGLEEKLVINLRELDCTTFAENCLALARTVKLDQTDFESFTTQLEKIRYRNGIRNQYISRLHYFSDWINNNDEKKFITKRPNIQGEKLIEPINFMSTHPESYPVLKEHPELIPKLANQEKELSKYGFYYFPKDDPQKLLNSLKQGDIIGLTTSIKGLDITHVGIIVKKDGMFHLLHASLSGTKVVLSEGPVTDFIKPESKNTGIVIARPIF